MAKKRKKSEPDDIESIQYARSLVRKAWAEMGIEEPQDPAAYMRGLVDKAMAELAERRENLA